MSRSQNFEESAGYLRASDCHNAPMHNNRCTNCGHRQAVNGVLPAQTRDLMKKNPAYMITELKGRAQAKKAGRNASAS
jgi:hypothetical protein